MPDRLAELRELEKAATPGPWKLIGDPRWPEIGAAADQRDFPGQDVSFLDELAIAENSETTILGVGNARLIVAMRNAGRALLDVVEAAQGVLLQSCPSDSLASGWRATQATALDHLQDALAKLEADE